MSFRLKDNTKLTPPPRCEEYIGEPLDEIITLLETKFHFHVLKDAQGQSNYRLITMHHNIHRVEILAFLPKNSSQWTIVDAFPLYNESANTSV